MSADVSARSMQKRRSRSRSIRKSVVLIEGDVKQEAAADGKLMSEKRRRSTKHKVSIAQEVPITKEDSIVQEDQDEESLLSEVLKYEDQHKPQVKPQVKQEDDEDSQILFLRNFKLDSDDEAEVTSNVSMTMIEVRRKLYLEECKKFSVIPVRAVAEMTENKQDLNVSHFSLGPKGAQALAIALHLNSTVTTLDMEYNDIGPYGCQSIAEVLLENNSIADVNLAHNNIGSHGLACICRIFKNNICIVKLNLSGNGFRDTNTKLLEFVLQHPFLKELQLSRNEFEEKTAKMLGEQLGNNETLEILDISWNYFRRRGAESIAQGIKDNTKLKKLDISYNGFGSEGIVAMSTALTSNQALQELDLSHNRITDEGITPLCNTLKTNESLLHLKIGGNPLSSLAAIALVTTINKYSACALVTLDLQEVFIDQNFLDLVKEIKATKSFFVTHGSIWDRELVKSKFMEAGQQAKVVLASSDVLQEKQVSETAKEAEKPQENQVSETAEEAEKPQENKVSETAEEAEKPQENQVSETAEEAEKPQENQVSETAEEAEPPQENHVNFETLQEKEEGDNGEENVSQLQIDAAGELNAT